MWNRALANLIFASGIAHTMAEIQSNWISLSRDLEFKPQDQETSSSMLRSVQERFLGYSDVVVDGTETMYDQYAQAWRFLGAYIDCGAVEQQRRYLEEGQQACQRYLLWAAYVDLDYQGGGTGEYQYYDPATKEWDQSACELHGNGRCAKMDCHLPSTHFKLLGFFKQTQPYEFLEQLLMHEGSCMGSYEDSAFLQNALDMWPQGCTQSATTTEAGDSLYYDIQPTSGGHMSIGLYTDNRCSIAYHGDITAEDVLYKDGTNVGDFDQFMEAWNAGLDHFRVCQPCMSYDLTNSYMEAQNNNGDDAAEENGGQEEDDGSTNEGYFVCQDNAGYNSVNQCMMFATQTNIERASISEINIASQQGTIARVNMAGVSHNSRFEDWWAAWGFFTLSMLVFVVGLVCFCMARSRRSRRQVDSNKEPLMGR